MGNGLYNALAGYIFPMTHGLYNIVQPLGYNFLMEYGSYNALAGYIFPMGHGLYCAMVSYLLKQNNNKTQLRTLEIQLGIGLMALEGNRVESRG